MNSLVLISAFVLGISSSLHCLGMCGPLIMAVPFAHKPDGNFKRLLYFIGKSVAYGVLGLIIGLLGFKALWGQSQRFLSIFSGIIILVLALSSFANLLKVKFPFQKQVSVLFQKIKQNPQNHYFFALGFLNGLLPCGMVYMALSIALASGGPLQGFFAMLVFGIGTAPALWILSAVKNKLNSSFRKKLKPATVILSTIVGIILILRGMNLGIPYISPNMTKTEMTIGTPSCH